MILLVSYCLVMAIFACGDLTYSSPARFFSDNRREFTIRHVEESNLLENWPQTSEIPFIKVLEATHIDASGEHKGLYQFSHLSFQGDEQCLKYYRRGEE